MDFSDDGGSSIAEEDVANVDDLDEDAFADLDGFDEEDEEQEEMDPDAIAAEDDDVDWPDMQQPHNDSDIDSEDLESVDSEEDEEEDETMFDKDSEDEEVPEDFVEEPKKKKRRIELQKKVKKMGASSAGFASADDFAHLID